MRTRFTEVLATAEGQQLLTTGEAAQLLGTSRQHVVDLCNAGDLPFVVVGKHRRVARADVESIQTGTRSLTRDQLRSLWLSHAVTSRLVEDPVTLEALGRRLGISKERVRQLEERACRRLREDLAHLHQAA